MLATTILSFLQSVVWPRREHIRVFRDEVEAKGERGEQRLRGGLERTTRTACCVLRMAVGGGWRKLGQRPAVTPLIYRSAVLVGAAGWLVCRLLCNHRLGCVALS